MFCLCYPADITWLDQGEHSDFRVPVTAIHDNEVVKASLSPTCNLNLIMILTYQRQQPHSFIDLGPLHGLALDLCDKASGGSERQRGSSTVHSLLNTMVEL